jgi:hypothetical protein
MVPVAYAFLAPAFFPHFIKQAQRPFCFPCPDSPGLSLVAERIGPALRLTLHYVGCFKKSFTNLQAYVNLLRGHTQCFEPSLRIKTHLVLPGIVIKMQQNTPSFACDSYSLMTLLTGMQGV